jgi:hypothetical protein
MFALTSSSESGLLCWWRRSAKLDTFAVRAIRRTGPEPPSVRRLHEGVNVSTRAGDGWRRHAHVENHEIIRCLSAFGCWANDQIVDPMTSASAISIVQVIMREAE